MGGIRKKTSKRGTTFQRSKIVKKAAETRKKNNRDSRKSQTWKAKKTTDPGIPNSFPFKAQILAELADAKQNAIEEKERRRLAQKAASKEARALITSAQGADGENDEDEEEEEDDEEDAKLRKQIARDVDEDEYLENPGVLPVYGKRPVNPVTASTKQKGKQVEVESEEEEEIPDLIDTELPTLQAALDRSDVVVEVLDARDPIGFRSQFLEQTILLGEEGSSSKAKNVWKDKLVILLNKIDLVPKEVAEAWLKFLRNAFPGSEVEGGKGNVRVSLFKASFVETPIKPGMTVYGLAKGETSLPPRAIPAGIPVGREGLLSLFAKWNKEKKGSEPLNVVFVGQPNVGKSAVINTLLGKPSLLTAPTLPSSNGVGPTTKVPAELALKATDGEVRLIDTPGWEFNPPDVENDDEDMEDEASDEEDGKWAVLEEMVARDMLTRNMGRIDKVKDTLPLVRQIVNRANAQDLMLAYNIPHFAAGDVEMFLTSIARAQGRIRKRGDADLDAAAKTVLRDWSHNLFPYYTLPTKSEIEKSKVTVGEMDQKALAMLKGRTEMKKVGKGLIRLKVPQIDERELILDEEMVQDLSDEEEGLEEDLEAFGVDPEDELEEDDLEESGDEVEFEDDDQPSDSEPEPEVVVSKKNEKKRKRKSSIGPSTPAPVVSKKARSVMFAATDDVAPVKKAEVKVGTSAKLKRKGGADEDESRDGKKARRGAEAVEIIEVVAEAVPAKREIKTSKKSALKKAEEAPVVTVAPVATKGKKAPAQKAEKAVKGKATGKKASAAVVEDKPFDFNAL